MGSWFVWEYTFLSAVGHIRLIRFLIFHLYLGSSRAPHKGHKLYEPPAQRELVQEEEHVVTALISSPMFSRVRLAGLVHHGLQRQA